MDFLFLFTALIMLIYAILTGYFFLFVLAQFVFKFHKNVDNRKLKDGERMISVDYIKNIH